MCGVLGSSLHWLPISGLAWLLYKCVASWRGVYGASTTERAHGMISKEKGISPRFRLSILSRYDVLSNKKLHKTNSFLLFYVCVCVRLFNPSIAEATSIQSTRTQRIFKIK